MAVGSNGRMIWKQALAEARNAVDFIPESVAVMPHSTAYKLIRTPLTHRTTAAVFRELHQGLSLRHCPTPAAVMQGMDVCGKGCPHGLFSTASHWIEFLPPESVAACCVVSPSLRQVRTCMCCCTILRSVDVLRTIHVSMSIVLI